MMNANLAGVEVKGNKKFQTPRPKEQEPTMRGCFWERLQGKQLHWNRGNFFQGVHRDGLGITTEYPLKLSTGLFQSLLTTSTL